jgi:hypothetical protein
MSFAILKTFLTRTEELGALRIIDEIGSTMKTIHRKGNKLTFEEVEFPAVERPPMIEVEAYRKKRGLS